MEQKVSGHWQPLAFFSRQLRPPERKYATFDRELLGIHLAIRHFRYFLEGRSFTVFTDHRPIIAALAKVSEPWTGRQARHLAAIAEATSDVRHIEGKNNVVADTLSRVPVSPTCDVDMSSEDEDQPFFEIPVNAVSPGVNYRTMAEAQELDPDTQNYRTAITNLILEDVPFDNGAFTLLCDVSNGSPRPIVPEAWRRRVFDSVHSLSHPGVRVTRKIIASKFVWHGLSKQVAHWARTCVNCQKSKIHTHTRAPLSEFPPTHSRFDHVHVDLVGPLPESQGFNHLLTVMDRFTRWPEVIPIRNIEAATVARAYISNWIARFGVPSLMTSDRGSQFISDLWSSMSNLLGTELHPTTAYHPQANGFIERLHRSLKASLKARLTSPNWMDELPWVLLGLRTVPKEDLNASAAELVYGAPLTVPGDFVPDTESTPIDVHLRQLREKVGDLRPVPTSAHDHVRTNVPSVLQKAKHVFIRRDQRKSPLQTPYDGPYEVIDRTDKYFTIRIGLREDKVSIDRLKAAHLDESLPIQVAQPPRRGRPLKNSIRPLVHSSTSSKDTSTDGPPPKPSYAEVASQPPTTTRSGRTIKTPHRFNTPVSRT